MSAVPQPRQGEVLPVGCFIDEATLAEVLSLAWVTFVDPEAVLVPVEHPGGEPGIVAEVGVHGEAPARIAISIDRAGARAVAERMVAAAWPGPALDDDDIDDAMGELANVLGGNLKALLPEGSSLTLPSVEAGPTGPAGEGAQSGGRVVAAVLWGEHLVTATVSSSPVPSSSVPSSTPAPAPKGTHP